MNLIALVVLAHFGQGVTLPPTSTFKAGHVTNGNFTLTVHNGEKPKHVVLGKLAFLERAIEMGNRVYVLTFAPQTGDIATFELKTNSIGNPIGVIQLNETEKQDAMGALFILMQRPFWPNVRSSASWTAKLPNPEDSSKSIVIECSAKAGPKNTILVHQSTKSSLIEAGFGAFIESDFIVDSKTGTIKSIHETVSSVKEGKASLVLEFDGKI